MTEAVGGQVPSVGRIVLVHGAYVNHQQVDLELPAIITHVWGHPGKISVEIFGQPSAEQRKWDGVDYAEEVKGSHTLTWRWPPRAGGPKTIDRQEPLAGIEPSGVQLEDRLTDMLRYGGLKPEEKTEEPTLKSYFVDFQFDKNTKSTISTPLSRVSEELKELKDRLESLTGFMGFSSGYASLVPAQQRLLKQQQIAMILYAGILEERINLMKADG